MNETVAIPTELVACMIEINSDLGYMQDCGIDEDVTETITYLQGRTAALLEQLDAAMKKDRYGRIR